MLMGLGLPYKTQKKIRTDREDQVCWAPKKRKMQTIIQTLKYELQDLHFVDGATPKTLVKSFVHFFNWKKV